MRHSANSNHSRHAVHHDRTAHPRKRKIKEESAIVIVSAICALAIGALAISYLKYGFEVPAPEVRSAPLNYDNKVIPIPDSGAEPSAPMVFGGNLKNVLASCVENNGKWLTAYNECENASADWCWSNNGLFNACASACRHNPDPRVMCTMQCVPVCMIGR